MISIEAKIRKTLGKKTKNLKKAGIIPSVLYGPEIENTLLEVDLKEFKKVLKEAGENTMISLKIKGDKSKEYAVLIKNVSYGPILPDPIHIDFYQPNLNKEIEASIPLEFIGSAPALQMGGTLLKNVQEITIKSLPQNLPHSIKVDISGLKTFEDSILIKDVAVPQNIKVVDSLEETVVKVMEPEKEEEQIVKSDEEAVDAIEKVEKKKKEKSGEEERSSK